MLKQIKTCRQIKTWARFAVFVTANGLALAGIYIFLVEPGFEILREQKKQIEHTALVLEHLRSNLTRKQSISSLDPIETEKAAQRFLQGNTENLQNADLFTRLRQIADAHGVSFSSVTNLAPRDWIGRQLVGARVEFTAPTQRVVELLSNIEDGPSFLFIRSAKLATAGEGDATEKGLGVSIEVYGVTRWSKG